MKAANVHLLIFVLALLALQACTHAAPRSIQFSDSSQHGLVVFGLGSEVAHPIVFTIAGFDVESNRASSKVFSGQFYVEHHGTQARHYVLPVPAGNYVIKDIVIHAPNVVTGVCLSDGTVAFKVDAGQQAFIGDFTFDGTTVKKVGANLRLAQDAMRDYPGVTGTLAPVGLTQTTFENKNRLGNEMCGG
jgi:hypothetical protein